MVARGLLCLPVWSWVSLSWTTVSIEGNWTRSSSRLIPTSLGAPVSLLVRILAGLRCPPLHACSAVEGLPQLPGSEEGRRELPGDSAGDHAVPRQARLREVKDLV